jgi:hypothetical protein
MDSAEKCPHPACECLVPKGGRFGKYCSEHCKEAASLTELRCHCHHPECTQPRPVEVRTHAT